MLYEKNKAPQLSAELFRNPTSEYRGTPFWSWNGKLEKDELLLQIEQMKEMGFGGFHMHVRTGMETPYLSEEFRDLVRTCTEKAKEEKMLAWLYDEDRWPSGSAGGIVTKDPAMRQRYVLFTSTPYQKNQGAVGAGEINSQAVAGRQENGDLLAVYDVQLQDGHLRSYRRISDPKEAKHAVYYAYREIAGNSPWYNNQAYVNTLDKKAMDRFIDVTYNFYQDAVGKDFGGAVPAIFTDEPQFSRKQTLQFAEDEANVCLPWSDDLNDTFRAAYGTDLLDHFPELIWDLADQKISTVRYHYHDHVCERFTEAFADNCGKWCDEHGLALTGHMMEEPTLRSQTAALGEAMRSYRGFALPGIDMLCARFELTTAKQCQSAVHQYGREGMLSELYGVTGWDFDFRGHKIHGDWQAALGVTIRVPHLAWYTMRGESKRDYPAAISYQSPWYKEYSYVEDHFARVASAMTRGKPDVRVAVIHPVESYWLHWGPAMQTAAVREQMDTNFQNVTAWLLKGTVDFDFICESLFPQLCPSANAPLSVGEMNYDVVIVPECETLRSTTLERLEAFRSSGGRLIFIGKRPTLENAEPSPRPGQLFDRSEQVPFSESYLLEALNDVRQVSIFNTDGTRTKNLIHQLRKDGDGKWLFIAHCVNPGNKDHAPRQNLRLTVKGEWNVTKYDTLTGDIVPVACVCKNGSTTVQTGIYDCDSLLYRLTPVGQPLPEGCKEAAELPAQTKEPICVPNKVRYTLNEPNACLLDQGEFALDDEEYQPCEEILIADNIVRKRLGIPPRGGHVAQPWSVEKVPATHRIRLRFKITSTFRCRVPFLALEDAENARIVLNGKPVPVSVCGWYVDKAIKKVLLPAVNEGENVIEVSLPIGPNTNTEWMYLLGNFAVTVRGREKTLSPLPETVSFDDLVYQGFPFYSGAFTYHVPVTTKGGDLAVCVRAYRGALLRVTADQASEVIAYPPYQARLSGLTAGEHTVDVTDYIPRSNGFGPTHNTAKYEYENPAAWRRTGDRWTYHYRFYTEGLLDDPQIWELN